VFAKAVEMALPYTKAVLICQRKWSGAVSCGIATFMVVNKDGWALTCFHVAAVARTHQDHAAEIASYKAETARIQSDSKLNRPERSSRTKLPKANQDWITNYSFTWDRAGVTFSRIEGHGLADLALVKLEGWDPTWVSQYPKFRDASRHSLKVGTSLCKLGYPLYNFNATFDAAADSFKIDLAEPMVAFPLDGIHTRNVNVLDNTGGTSAKFIETSTPGLGGQSGGPIFDVEGGVWGVQSRTAHYDLGWSVPVLRNGRKLEQHPSFHVGWGAHVEEAVSFMRRVGVAHDLC
jgi:hypothetical protein